MQPMFPNMKRAVALLVLFTFCVLANGCGTPQEVPAGTVVIEGNAIKAATSFTLEELKSMEEGLVEADYVSINSYGTKEYFHYKGVWVWHIIKEKVNLRDNAAKVSFTAEDGYTVEFTLEDVKKEDYIDEGNPNTKYKMILAWEENGQEFNPAKGNPFQLVVGQRELGDVNKPYWVRNVKTICIE
jgi:DMSO/TMAO reductase YedYZ molybdopterin-dependent catalytic subunit